MCLSCAVQIKEEIAADHFKPNCALVCVKFMIRHGLVTPESGVYLCVCVCVCVCEPMQACVLTECCLCTEPLYEQLSSCAHTNLYSDLRS